MKGNQGSISLLVLFPLDSQTSEGFHSQSLHCNIIITGLHPPLWEMKKKARTVMLLFSLLTFYERGFIAHVGYETFLEQILNQRKRNAG